MAIERKNSNFTGTTKENSRKKEFEYPSPDICALIARGEKTAEFGCPMFAEVGVRYCSCSSEGEGGYICEYAIQHEEKK